MTSNLSKTATLTLAISATCISMLISLLGSYSRAQDETHRIILAGVSLLCAIAVHTLPALSRRSPKPLKWSVWALCFILVAHSHCVSLLEFTEQSAEIRYSTSRHARSIQERRESIKRELSAIQARPIATIARLMARAKSNEQIESLRLELDESQRAVRLQDQLDSLAATFGNAAPADPLSELVATITGWSPSLVTVTFGVLTALLLELLGAIFWLEALGSASPEVVTADPGDRGNTRSGYHPRYDGSDGVKLALLREALERGNCTTRVADIRRLLRCGQAQAMLLRRQLVQSQTELHPKSLRK